MPISGATAANYALTSADVGYRLSALVTATNAGGEASQTSELTAVIASTLALARMPVGGPVTASPPPALKEVFTPPRRCISARSETIHWRTTTGVRLVRITITLNGKPYTSLSGSMRHATISFVGRGPGRVLVRIAGRSATGRSYSAGRAFHLCIPGLPTTQPRTQFLSHA